MNERIAKMLAGRRAAREAGAKPKPPASPRQAIKAKCRDCIYDSLTSGSAVKQIAACTSIGCALWPWRPGSSPRRGVSISGDV